MKVFYNVSITKQAVGTAVMHKEPPLLGQALFKVTDVSTAGDYKLIVMECDAEQHAVNLAYPGVATLQEPEAVKLASNYQPKRSLTELDPSTRKAVKTERPAVDLKQLLAFNDERLALAASGAGKTPAKKTRAKTTRAAPKPAQ